MRGKGLLAAFLLVLVVMISGCTRLDTIRVMNRENLMKLSIGITKQEVLDIMGTETFSTSSGRSINNPYRNEVLYGKNGKVLEVLYYYTDIKRTDDGITDDELTPLVFDGGKLIGWGWGFLEVNIQKYEIRIR